MRTNNLLPDILPKGVFESFQTLDRFALSFGAIPRRLEMERLIFILVNIRNGFGHCVIDGTRIDLKPGKLLLVNPYSFLHLENIKYVLGDVILFSEAFFCTGSRHEQLLYKVIYQPGRQSHILLDENSPSRSFVNSNIVLFGNTLTFSSSLDIKNALMHSSLQNIILHLHKVQLEIEGRTYDLEEPIAKKEVIQFIKLLNTNFRQHHDTEFYARQMNVTVRQLTIICQTGIGYTAKEVILSKILVESRRLLLYDPRSVSDLSFELGFTEPGNFSKLFLSHTGSTPGNFRVMNNVVFS